MYFIKPLRNDITNIQDEYLNDREVSFHSIMMILIFFNDDRNYKNIGQQCDNV